MAHTPRASSLCSLPPCLRGGWMCAWGGVLLLADQLSKWWIFEHVLRVNGQPRGLWAWLTTPTHWSLYGAVGDFAPVTLLPFANLVMVWNRGVSFGMLSSAGAAAPLLLIGLAGVIVTGLVVWLCRTQQPLLRAALVLIIAGALGNVHDRLRFGAVADFMDLHVAGYHWPAFNLADSAIVIGAILLALDALFGRPLASADEERKG